MIISLIRFALIAPAGDAGTEPTPPIGLAYIAGMCKDADLDVEVNGIDAAGRSLNKIFNGFPKIHIVVNTPLSPHKSLKSTSCRFLSR